jgi:hypothetical protein
MNGFFINQLKFYFFGFFSSSTFFKLCGNRFVTMREPVCNRFPNVLIGSLLPTENVSDGVANPVLLKER